jgi:hypothetical protein
MAKGAILDDPVRRLVASRIQELGLDMANVSRELGRNHAYLFQFLTKGTPVELPEATRIALAAILRVDEARLRLAGAPSKTPARGGSVVRPIPKSELVGDRTLPLYAAAMGGEGFMIVTFDAIDYLKRPIELEGVRDGYGLLIYGGSMSPAFREGDMALVHPHLAPHGDREFVFYHTPPDGQAEAMIKTLVNWNDQRWKLRQYNPAKDFTESRVDWPIAHRVVGKYDRR